MRYFFLAILLMLALTGCSTNDNPQPALVKSDIWVAISLHRANSVGEVQVLLPRKTYNAIVSGEQKSGWLELKNVYWSKNGEPVPQDVAGEVWGYGKDYIIKIENVDRIIPLSEEAIEKIQNMPKR